MKVKELIAKLQECDEELEIEFYEKTMGFNHEVVSVQLNLNDNIKYLEITTIMEDIFDDCNKCEDPHEKAPTGHWICCCGGFIPCGEECDNCQDCF